MNTKNTVKDKGNQTNTLYSTFAVLFYINRQKINKDMKKVSDHIGRKYRLPIQNNNKNE